MSIRADHDCEAVRVVCERCGCVQRNRHATRPEHGPTLGCKRQKCPSLVGRYVA